MCFSATASFIASGSLGAAGAITVSRMKKDAPLLPFAVIPLLFAVQQGIEGLIWLSGGSPSFFHDSATYAYVMFSHILWPAYVPIAVRMIEPGKRRKRLLNWFIFLGIGVSIYILYYVFKGPVTATLSARGIIYGLPLPNFVVVPLAYVVATVGSCLASRHKFVRVFGLAMLASLIIAYWYYQAAFTSVWCFFAAVLSFIVIVHVYHESKAPLPAPLQKLKAMLPH